MQSISVEQLAVEFQSAATLRGHETRRRMWTRAAYELPLETRKRILIARSIVSAARGSSCAIQIEEWGVFPQYMLPGIYKQLRGSFGITDDVRDKPCDIFDENEGDKALLFVGAALLNDWDFWFLTPKDEVVVHSKTHDDIISLEIKDPKLRKSLVEWWEQLGCRRLSQKYLRELAPLLFSDE